MSIGRPPGEPSNFHRIRETTTVNARNARSRRGNEACHSSGARNREKFHPLREFLRNFLSRPRTSSPPLSLTTRACDIYCVRLLYICRSDLSTGILTFSPTLGRGATWEIGNGVGDKIRWIAREGKRLCVIRNRIQLWTNHLNIFPFL